MYKHIVDISKYIVGQFDVIKYCRDYHVIDNIVILMPERKKHILLKHPEVCSYVFKLCEILNDPDEIYIEILKKNTLWIVKVYEKCVKVTLKLITNDCHDSHDTYYKNSIIQMQLIRRARLNKYLERKKIKKIFDKKNKL